MSDHDQNGSLPEAYARLLSLAVHELRTPASVVGGYLRMLQRDAESPLSDRQRRMVVEADKSCARMVELINELSEVSKLDAGLAAVRNETFDLFAVVREAAAAVRDTAADRDVRLEVRGPEAGASIHGDLARLRAAFGAVLRAIAREQPASAVVLADCQRILDGRAASIRVAVARDTLIDTIVAAPARPVDEKRGGIGLALPIARRVIERHGGKIWSPHLEGVDESVGRGAILVSLPLLEQSR